MATITDEALAPVLDESGTPLTDETLAAPFPSSPLDIGIDLSTGPGAWQAVTGYAGGALTTPAVSLTRGRPDEATQASPATCNLTLANEDYRFSPYDPTGAYYGMIGRNTPLRVSVPDATPYLRLENDQASSASTPSTGPLNFTGDLEARIDVLITGWTASVLAAKWTGNTGGNYQWAWLLNSDGTLAFWSSTDGSTITVATSTQPLPWPGGRISLKAIYRASSGQVSFHYATSIGGTYTQLGKFSPPTSGGNLFAGTGTLRVGAQANLAQLPGYTGTYPFPASYQGLTGKVYEFRLLAGIGGTLVANPVFSSQATGTGAFSDNQGNAWTVGGTAELSQRLYLHHGEVPEWPPVWDPAVKTVTTTIAAAGQLRRLQQNSAPLASAMTRAWQRKTSIYAPLAYWPVEDGSGATAIASGLPGGRPMALTGKISSLGASSPISSTAAMGVPGTGTWTGSVPPYTQPATSPANVCRFLLSVPSGGDTDTAILARMFTRGGTVAQFDLQYGAVNSGSPQVVGYDVNGVQLFASGYFSGVGSGTTLNGNPLLMEFALTVSGGTITWHVNVLLAGQPVQAGGSGTISGSLGKVTSIEIAPGTTNVKSAFGQIAVQSSYATMSQSNSADALIGPLNAWAYEPAGLRVARLCQEQGYGVRLMGPPAATVPMGAQSAQSFATLLQECEDADHGMLFDCGSSMAIGYRTSASMCAQAGAISGAQPVTLDYSLGHTPATGWAPRMDDQLTINDEIVSRTGGGSSAEATLTAAQYAATSALSTAPPPAGVGLYQDSRQVNVQSDSQLPDQAGWTVHLGTVDEMRHPAIPVDLAGTDLTSLFYPVLSAECGDYAEVLNPPALLTPNPVKAIVYQVAVQLGVKTCQVQWVTRPESPYEVLIAGTGATTDCRTDNDGSTVFFGFSAAATSFTVAGMFGGSTPPQLLWTTVAGDFPFDIIVAGERMTVTNITGSSSPQTFTVTRAVNGVAKSHLSGETVRLFQPCYQAIA